MLLYTWQEAGKEGRLILSSGAKYNQINFSKNHVSGNARKIGVTVIWWFTLVIEGNMRVSDIQYSGIGDSHAVGVAPDVFEVINI